MSGTAVDSAFNGAPEPGTKLQKPLKPVSTLLKECLAAEEQVTRGLTSNVLEKNGHISNGHISNGHASNGHLSNGHTSNGNISNGHESSGHLSDGHESNGHISNGHAINGHIDNDQESNERISNGHQRNGSICNGYTSNGHVSNACENDGHIGNGHAGKKHMINGHTGNGLVSNGHASNGPTSSGHLANGHLTNGHAGNGYTSNEHASNGDLKNGHVNNGDLTKNTTTNGELVYRHSRNGKAIKGFARNNGEAAIGKLTDGLVGKKPYISDEEYMRSYTGKEIIWHNVILIGGLHIAALYCLTLPIQYRTLCDLRTIAWGIACSVFAGFGVTGGAHRLWTHRCFKAKLPLRIILMIGFSSAGHDSIYEWARDHRVHHKFSETDADPHNVARGFFFAHVGWLMRRKHPEVRRRGREVDMSDIMADPVAAFESKYHIPLVAVLCFILPSLVPYWYWNEHFGASIAVTIIRYVFVLNSTWSVNSFAHMFGGKPFDRYIAPAENVLVSFFTMGEGWHNYHHVFPWDYKAAELGFINATKALLDLFAYFGWAYDLKTASPTLVKRVAEKYGDGSHPHFTTVAPEIPVEAEAKPEALEDLLPSSLALAGAEDKAS